MKILVFSDCHGCPGYIRAAMRVHPDCEAAVFLGDGASDAESVLAEFPNVARCVLSGNCDSKIALLAHGLAPVEETVLEFGGLRFFCLHGHTRGVKSGYERVLWRAAEVGADAVLFGHTHVPLCEYERNPGKPSQRILLFNPGSIGLSYHHPYGVIHVVGGVISAGHGHVES